jgi:NAD(P)H dehydrogenase (quinone)
MILVTGATGHVGRAVVCRLASLGHDGIAMVRDVQAASRRLPSGIALRVADYEDASALKRALAGIDDVVLISSDGDASAVLRHHSNAIEAATATNIRHITSRASSIPTSCRHSTSRLLTETQSAD